MLVPLPSYFGSPFPARPLPLLDIGHWFALKYRRQAATSGVHRTACNLRKQGVPLDIALAILAPRTSRWPSSPPGADMPHPTNTPGITARIAELAARSTGVASNDPGLSLWDVTVICNVANKMVKRRQLFKVKYSHRSVRYFGNERDAAAAAPGPTRGLVAHLITPKSTRQMPSATWAATEPVITPKTKFTVGPSHPPRFREIVLPFVHGGNQRGRV